MRYGTYPILLLYGFYDSTSCFPVYSYETAVQLPFFIIGYVVYNLLFLNRSFLCLHLSMPRSHSHRRAWNSRVIHSTVIRVTGFYNSAFLSVDMICPTDGKVFLANTVGTRLRCSNPSVLNVSSFKIHKILIRICFLVFLW